MICRCGVFLIYRCTHVHYIKGCGNNQKVDANGLREIGIGEKGVAS